MIYSYIPFLVPVLTALSLLVGQSQGHGDGEDATTIIAVSVAIPVAVCIVFMVILAALMLIVVNYVRAKLRRGGMVNFTTGDLLRHDVDRNDHVVTL